MAVFKIKAWKKSIQKDTIIVFIFTESAFSRQQREPGTSYPHDQSYIGYYGPEVGYCSTFNYMDCILQTGLQWLIYSSYFSNVPKYIFTVIGVFLMSLYY